MPPARNTETEAATGTEIATTGRKTPKKRTTPMPAHILLKSISDALAGGVNRAEILTLVNMARMATSTQQSPVWKMVAEALDTATKAANGTKPQDS